jgi:hypothetical protein
VPAFWFARSIDPNYYEELYHPYRDSVWVQRAIKIISGPIASLDLEFGKPETPGIGKAGSGERRAKRGERINPRRGFSRSLLSTLPSPGASAALAAWMREPMRGFGWSDFIEASITWLKLQECFWLLSDEFLVPFPEAQTKYPPIVVANPGRMRHLIENGELVGWSYIDMSGKSWSLHPEQVIQLKYFNPYDPWRGLGEYPAASVAAEADWLAGKFVRNLSANNGDTGPLIVAKSGVPTEPQREQIIAELRAKRAAQQRGQFKPMFMTGDMRNVIALKEAA